MNQNLIYLVGAGHYDVLRLYVLGDERQSVPVMEIFVQYGSDDPLIFEMFMSKHINLEDAVNRLIEFGKINIIKHLITSGATLSIWCLHAAVDYNHRKLAKFLYEQTNQFKAINFPPQWFADFVASRESYRSLALLVMHATRGNKRDVGRMISRVIWENRAQSADE